MYKKDQEIKDFVIKHRPFSQPESPTNPKHQKGMNEKFTKDLTNLLCGHVFEPHIVGSKCKLCGLILTRL